MCNYTQQQIKMAKGHLNQQWWCCGRCLDLVFLFISTLFIWCSQGAVGANMISKPIFNVRYIVRDRYLNIGMHKALASC